MFIINKLRLVPKPEHFQLKKLEDRGTLLKKEIVNYKERMTGNTVRDQMRIILETSHIQELILFASIGHK